MSISATTEININVIVVKKLTRVRFDLARRRSEPCANEKAKIIKIITGFKMELESIISQIAPTVIKNPNIETMNPPMENIKYFLLSYKTLLHKPVRLYPPIVSVVKRSLVSISPKLPIKNIRIAINALRLSEAISVTRNTLFKLSC